MKEKMNAFPWLFTARLRIMSTAQMKDEFENFSWGLYSVVAKVLYSNIVGSEFKLHSGY